MSEGFPSLTEDAIRALASSQSFARGFSYYDRGALFHTQRTGDELRGFCQGSSHPPYLVTARIGLDGVTVADCTCPYDWGGICKHIVALLLTWMNTPEAFESVASVDERLAGKSKKELLNLVKEMLRRGPDLERLLDLPLRSDPDAPFDLDAFRRQIDIVLRGEFPDPVELAFELVAIVETAHRIGAEGHWSRAGALYHLVLSKIIPRYGELYDEEGDISRVLQQCATGVGSCLTDVTPDSSERHLWLDALLEAEFMNIQMGGIDLAYPAAEILVEEATDEEWSRIENQVRQRLPSFVDRYSR